MLSVLKRFLKNPMPLFTDFLFLRRENGSGTFCRGTRAPAVSGLHRRDRLSFVSQVKHKLLSHKRQQHHLEINPDGD